MILTKDSSVYKIFHYSYECRVPEYSLIPEKIVDWLGTHLNELNPESAPHQSRSILLLIDDMLELFREGIPIDIVHTRDAIEIHDILMGHMEMWLTYGHTTTSRFAPPMADLRLMDDFAAAICANTSAMSRREGEIDTPDQLIGITSMDGKQLESIDRYTPIPELAHLMEIKNYYG